MGTIERNRRSESKKTFTTHIANGRDTLSSTFHEEGWSCWLGATKCEDFSRPEIKDWIFQKAARCYWFFKQYITYEQFDIIEWNLISKLMAEKTQLYRLWFSKHHANWCGCGNINTLNNNCTYTIDDHPTASIYNYNVISIFLKEIEKVKKYFVCNFNSLI